MKTVSVFRGEPCKPPMRPRKPNWSTEQKLLLVQLVKARREDLLTGRHSCREIATNRRWTWDEIAEEISTAHPDVPRTGKECERHWFVELAKAKEAMLTHMSHTEHISPVTKVVFEILRLQRKEAELNDRVEDDNITFQEEVDVKYVPGPVAPVINIELPVNHINDTTHAIPPVSPPLSLPVSPPVSPPHTPSPSAEKKDLEMLVLRRQERVLQLQEEYYSLKIKHLKARMLMDL